ncbi:hypothetical protein B7494_g3769 [Chlorociboria aeruginascens]|nr:hypothetical protein B7494_g3769 [Chlorociboria aeruginascens]
MLFAGFREFDVTVGPEVTIHGIIAGDGPPLLLLHGFPQNHLIWHIVAPQLTSTYTVVAVDLRGYGASSKPPPSSDHSAYAKSKMAQDCVLVMSNLGFSTFSICSHDRGARVAHKLCVDHPSAVQKVMFLDIAPTLSMFEKTDMEFARKYWHWFFLIQPSPFPESCILANQQGFANIFFWRSDNGFDGEALETYVKQLSDPDTVKGMCEDYRAAASVDLEEAREDLKLGRRIQCPVRVLWGKKGVIESCFDALEEWRAVSDGLVDGEHVDSGHYIPEEVPEALVKHIREFFV